MNTDDRKTAELCYRIAHAPKGVGYSERIDRIVKVLEDVKESEREERTCNLSK